MTACGSKLVTNWLTANGFRVVSESTVIAHLDNVVDSSSQRRLLLAKIVGLYANSGLRSTVPTLLKLSARSLNLLEDIRALNPQVPVVFLARNPLEVIASNLDNPRGWVRAKESTPRFAARFLELPESHLADMSLEEYMARTLARMCVLALPFLGRRTLVLDYQNLDSCSLNLLSNLLGRGHSHKKRLSASNCLSYYDGVSSGDPFHCANLAKLSRVRPSFVEACDRWAIPAYRCLLETAGQN